MVFVGEFAKVENHGLCPASPRRAARRRFFLFNPLPNIGGRVLVRCLETEGVKHIWGLPSIYDALYKQSRSMHPGPP